VNSIDTRRFNLASDRSEPWRSFLLSGPGPSAPERTQVKIGLTVATPCPRSRDAGDVTMRYLTGSHQPNFGAVADVDPIDTGARGCGAERPSGCTGRDTSRRLQVALPAIGSNGGAETPRQKPARSPYRAAAAAEVQRGYQHPTRQRPAETRQSGMPEPQAGTPAMTGLLHAVLLRRRMRGCSRLILRRFCRCGFFEGGADRFALCGSWRPALLPGELVPECQVLPLPQRLPELWRAQGEPWPQETPYGLAQGGRCRRPLSCGSCGGGWSRGAVVLTALRQRHPGIVGPSARRVRRQSRFPRSGCFGVVSGHSGMVQKSRKTHTKKWQPAP